MPTPEIVGSLILKWIGAMAGAALALLFVPPRNIKAFRRRVAFSLISGMIFAIPARDYAGFNADEEGLVAGACIAAAIGWGVMDAIMRITRNWRQP